MKDAKLILLEWLGIVNAKEVLGEGLLREDFDVWIIVIIGIRVWGFETESGNAKEVSEDGIFEGGSEWRWERGFEF
jgi:hypothetical protein